MLKLQQFFIKVGKDRYAVTEAPEPGQDLYIWDEAQKRIVPYPPNKTNKD